MNSFFMFEYQLTFWRMQNPPSVQRRADPPRFQLTPYIANIYPFDISIITELHIIIENVLV